MSDKLKCAEADIAHGTMRDAVVAAAIKTAEAKVDVTRTPMSELVRLRVAVRNYQAFASFVDPGPNNCAPPARICPALQIAGGRVAARAVPQFLSLFGRIQGSIVCKVSDETFSELRIARAYIKLLCIPESKTGARMVSLGWIGDYEVRMFEGSQTSYADAPLFWMELFDQNAQTSLDSSSCHSIEDAVAVFEDLISQAKCSNESSARGGNDTQS